MLTPPPQAPSMGDGPAGAGKQDHDPGRLQPFLFRKLRIGPVFQQFVSVVIRLEREGRL